MSDWEIVKSEAVIKDRHLLIKQIREIHPWILESLKLNHSTWDFSQYNIFGSLCGSVPAWHLYHDICTNVRRVFNSSKPIWMQAWVNFDMPDKVLDWHKHGWPLHGYVSIDCKSTQTQFRKTEPEKDDTDPTIDYIIDNEDGNIYIGPGNRWHKVKVLRSYPTPRITIGFDVTDRTDCGDGNHGLMPVL